MNAPSDGGFCAAPKAQALPEMNTGVQAVKKALITDVDNTLFDWVDIWYKSFSAMMEKVEDISSIQACSLYPSISAIHQKYQTSEYAFLLEEIPELKEKYGDRINEVLYPAIQAFRDARRSALRLYPGVKATLDTLRSKGVTLIAYTESMSFYTNYRFRRLGLDEIFDYLYSPPDHALPEENLNKIRKYPQSHYQLARTFHRHTPKGEVKPNPEILLSIIRDVGITEEEALYVGDSLMKDIAMAQEAQILDAHAAYGIAQDRKEYELLRKVTHWTPADVEREKLIHAGPHVKPTIILDKAFAQILPHF